MERNLAQILGIILHTGEMLEEDMKQETELKNLTTRQLVCIELIKELSNPTLTELAAKLKIAKASISVMIERLEKNEYLKKVISDNDRRIAHIHLTEKGEKAASLHAELHTRIAKAITSNMTNSERIILTELLNKSVNALKIMNNKKKH